MPSVCFIRVLCLSFSIVGVRCLNVATSPGSFSTITDEANPSEDTSSFFGYSIAFGSNTLEIGSPLASAPNNQKRGGAILRCQTESLFNEPRKKTICSDVTPQPAKSDDAYGQTVYNSHSGLTVACSATKKQECTGVNYNPGYCYRSFNGGRTWKAGPKTSRIDCTQKLDLMIVLDGSASIGLEDFEKVKTWTIELASNFNIETQAAQIGVVQYSEYKSGWSQLNQIKTEVKLGECRNQTCFRERVMGIDKYQSMTYTAHALNKTVTDFQGSHRFHSSLTSKVLILLTDGRSTDSEYLRDSANYVRSVGITTFAVGVGKKINETELQVIANGGESMERVFNVDDFDQLQTIVGQLKNEIFKLALEGGENHSSIFYGQEMGQTGFSVGGSKKMSSHRLRANDR